MAPAIGTLNARATNLGIDEYESARTCIRREEREYGGNTPCLGRSGELKELIICLCVLRDIIRIVTIVLEMFGRGSNDLDKR